MKFHSVFHGSVSNIFQMKICDNFLIFGRNIDCGCSLKLPRWVILTSNNNLSFEQK